VNRLRSVDALRGLVMIIMALDLIWLPVPLLLTISIVVIALHNLVCACEGATSQPVVVVRLKPSLVSSHVRLNNDLPCPALHNSCNAQAF